jgi:hypothetical protein
VQDQLFSSPTGREHIHGNIYVLVRRLKDFGEIVEDARSRAMVPVSSGSATRDVLPPSHILEWDN